MAKISVDRDGAMVYVAISDGPRNATLALKLRSASALEGLLFRATATDEDFDGEADIEGELTVKGPAN